MPGIIVVGCQWGDEGKGKIIDVFSSHADFVVRFQGGANAGHTLVVNGQKTVLHLVPSGVLHSEPTCIIAPGVVVDIEGLVEEIRNLKKMGYLQSSKKLLLSDSASLLLPYHKVLDQAREEALSLKKIGTTGKGIGPAYEDRASRRGLVVADLFDPISLREKLELALSEKNILLEHHYHKPKVDINGFYERLLTLAEELAPYRCKDVSQIIYRAIKSGKKVLFEGAQATLLDILHGTYPYVTSSSTLAGSACTSVGMGPTQVQKVIGIAKAYTTRVGSGPFPTELTDEIGERLRKDGHEFGSTTGRPRRCGWFDLVAMKYAIRLNGISNLALMKLDVLTGFEKIGVCTAYKIGEEIVAEMPTSLDELEKATPVIEWIPGWTQDISKITSLKDLPRSTTGYIDYLGNQLGTPIDVISVGPGREQTLWVKPLFNP